MTKTIIFIRHGEAEHNIGFQQFGEKAYYDQKYKFAGLTKLGYDQAKTLADNINKNIPKPDIILCSSLDRAIQTAIAIFGNQSNISITDDLRELNYDHPVNERRTLKDLQNLYKIDTSRITSDQDVLFTNGDTYDRVDKMFDLLLDMDFETIVVISHHDFLYRFIQKFIDPKVSNIPNCCSFIYELKDNIFERL